MTNSISDYYVSINPCKLLLEMKFVRGIAHIGKVGLHVMPLPLRFIYNISFKRLTLSGSEKAFNILRKQNDYFSFCRYWDIQC